MVNELFSLVQALQVLCLYRSVWGIAIVIKYTITARRGEHGKGEENYG